MSMILLFFWLGLPTVLSPSPGTNAGDNLAGEASCLGEPLALIIAQTGQEPCVLNHQGVCGKDPGVSLGENCFFKGNPVLYTVNMSAEAHDTGEPNSSHTQCDAQKEEANTANGTDSLIAQQARELLLTKKPLPKLDPIQEEIDESLYSKFGRPPSPPTSRKPRRRKVYDEYQHLTQWQRWQSGIDPYPYEV